jgi:hypothetical protein
MTLRKKTKYYRPPIERTMCATSDREYKMAILRKINELKDQTVIL